MTAGWRIVMRAMALLATAALVTLAIFAAVYLPGRGIMAGAEVGSAFTRAEFITIILAAVTVILAVLAIVLAVAAVAGYVAIRDAAIKAAEIAATRRAEEVAPRAAEKMTALMQGNSAQAGDDFARAAGDDNAGAS